MVGLDWVGLFSSFGWICFSLEIIHDYIGCFLCWRFGWVGGKAGLHT